MVGGNGLISAQLKYDAANPMQFIENIDGLEGRPDGGG